ncbi:metallophosphoesterase [Staphylococcus sp. NRL 16/872]|uniref:YfcE family phosphodiesterase n=1 Tax=Staphylococcus sp. NRL 16/872 TaxID=2930131 RepID=UPI001FB493B8|nr:MULTISPECIES: metallophosphoesterase [unclassified Staphylococcus]MCJ1656583.1 metallophosphoesterase [Staphylococcus sp. NRL 21/187]MCJ1662338.1 metallophosphoesterase [Staphylococcus sp. NRL 18/288]MCJ1668422.1 metallophosphoesterase [Staphylococcus sp. NRL 19/737]WEN68633.1 metallophosphoesterase [Staphylococcus sp. NRL 16/872]
MTKWLIASDNHNEAGILYQLYEQHNDANVFIHLGDSEFEYNDTELSLFRRVKGNCDFYPEFPNEEIVEVNGIKAFYTHGHLYSVNQTRMRLAEKAQTLGGKLAFYGHTHVAKYEKLGDVHVINPGSISQSRSNIEETFAELLIDDNNQYAKLNFRNRNNEIIDTVEFDI